MNLFKFLKIGLLFAGMALCAVAEQRVVVVVFDYREPIRFTQVDALLRRGWRIVNVTTARSSNDYGNWSAHAIFVLESPESKEEKK